MWGEGGKTIAPLSRYNETIMADVIEILKSSGPISLDELNLRTSSSPAELALRLAGLRKSGQINVRGPQPNDLANLSEGEIRNASDVVVELSRAAMRRLTR
jgi:hypothetical protein